jgi:site-specific recombinase XerD
MTWTEAVKQFLGNPDLAASTVKQYRISLDAFHTWYCQTYDEDPDPALLTREEVHDWRGYLSGVQKQSASTVNRHLSAVRGLARFCGNRVEVHNVRRVQRPVETLTGREQGRLLKAAGERHEHDHWMDLRNVAMIGMMVGAGLRVSEVCGLDVGDVAINARSGQATVRRGKGLKERRVPLKRDLREALAAYLEKRPRTAKGETALFLSNSGRRLAARDVQRLIRATARRAGIGRDVTPHTLRHTFATRFLRKGGDLATLQDILGHANIATTSRYLHPDEARVQEMVEEL